MSERQPQIQGEPLTLDELLDLVNVDNLNRFDLEDAAEYWDDTASADFIGALDSDPVEDE